MERFVAIITEAVKHCCKVLHLRYSRGSDYAFTISMLHFSMLHFFHVAFLHVSLFPCCTFSMLHFFHSHFFHVVLFPSRTLFMLHFLHVSLFSCCTFSCYIHVARFSRSMLRSFHVALAYYWKILKMNWRQKMQPKSDLKLGTMHLVLFYFGIL